MNLPSSHNLNSSQERVSSSSGVSCFWDIHHSHGCSFNMVWVKWIRSLLVLKCCVSIYASTWCDHGHTHLVFVSFPTKEFDSLTLMVALAEPPFGALPMAPKPFVIQFINLAISWFYVVASPYWTINTQKASIRAKNSLDDFSALGASSFCFSRNTSITKHSRACLPYRKPYLGLATKARACKKETWEAHLILPGVQESVKEWTLTLPRQLPLRELESRRTPESSRSDCRGQNPLVWKVLYIIGKLLKCGCLKWAHITHLDIWNTSYGQKKGQESNWQFDSRPLKIKNWPDFLVCRWRATYR